jgi:RNA polymerase-interacting CarD/CdnL/TRCF family regulator
MSFRAGQAVAFPVFGLGRIAAVVTKTDLDGNSQEFYEIAGEYSTLWVPVGEAAQRGLRRLATQAELPQYRAILTSQPSALSGDARLRQREVQTKLKRGTLQDWCEVVRDLSALRGRGALREYDGVELKKSLRWLSQEWAAAAGMSVAQAAAEIDTLLRGEHQARAI